MKCSLIIKTAIVPMLLIQVSFVYADWSILPSSPSNVQAVESYNGALYAGGAGGVFAVSYNNGDSWTNIDTGLLSYCSIVSLCLTDSAYIVGCNGMGIWELNDSGEWVQKKGGAVLAVVQADSLIFAGQQVDPLSGDPGGVFYSIDYGDTWSKIDSFPTDNVKSLAYSHGKLYVGGLYTIYSLNVSDFSVDTLVDLYAPSCMEADSNIVLVGSHHGLYYSDDFGMHWRHIHETVSATEIVKDDSVIYVAGWRIFCTTDTGGHWTDLTGSISNDYLGSFGLHNGYLFTNIAYEPLQRQNSPYTTTINPQTPKSIDDNQILVASPNPFITWTKVRFNGTNDATVRIYSMKGKLVIDDRWHTDGKYAWDGKDTAGESVPAGVYCMQVTVGDKMYAVSVVKQ